MNKRGGRGAYCRQGHDGAQHEWAPNETRRDQQHNAASTARVPPASYFLKKAAKLESGSKAPGRDKVGAVTKAQVREIAEQKMKDLNCDTLDAAAKMIEGSARSMGIEVVGG